MLFSVDLPTGMLTKLWSHHGKQVFCKLSEEKIGEIFAKLKFVLREVQRSGGKVQERH